MVVIAIQRPLLDGSSICSSMPK